jgi:SAM-dependent methyltransferase
MKCRFCHTPLSHVFIDLANAPASNSFLTSEQLNEPEVYFPLKVFVCHNCFLVQVDEHKKPDAIFNEEYVYFSSFSTSWLAHSKRYTEMVMPRFGLSANSLVIELASNDGYLLQYFNERGIPVLGIEPTANTAAVAREKGIETITEFFGTSLANRLASEGRYADLLLGNNVLAHVPDIVDFVAGMKIILKPGGVITMEFPHLLQLVLNNQFDTIYHEHFSYLSLYTVRHIFESRGLVLFDVEELPTHGGSLRIFAKHNEHTGLTVSPNVTDLITREEREGITGLQFYTGFQKRAEKVKLDLLEFLIQQKKEGKVVAAYGAAAKGNTLLNYCGIKADLLRFVVDVNPAKQGKFLPGSHIPVVNEQVLRESEADHILIFPWNIKEEVREHLIYLADTDNKFLVAIPSLQFL